MDINKQARVKTVVVMGGSYGGELNKLVPCGNIMPLGLS